MNEWRRISRTAIGVSAALHIGIAGVLCLHVGIPPVRNGPVSILQVRLADSLEGDPPSAGNRKASAPNPKRGMPRFHRANTVSPTTPQPETGVETVIPSVQDERKSDSLLPEIPAESDGGPSGLTASVTSQEKREEGGNAADRSNEIALFLQDVRSRLESAKRYPWLARLHGQEGIARVQFLIDPGGEIREIHILESSQSKLLDDEAIETVKRVGRFPRIPTSWSKNVRIQVPMVFRLNSP
jgi:TonB family protein